MEDELKHYFQCIECKEFAKNAVEAQCCGAVLC